MSLTFWTTSFIWKAAGWTMLHLLWVGAAIGLMSAPFAGLWHRPAPRRGIASRSCVC